MKIDKLVIGDFGKLSDVSISLDPKVTVITGKNEAGKSSIASFIKYMLYGFSSSRSTSPLENDKKKYMPWENESCSGELHFTSHDGKSYRAARKTSAKTQVGVFDSDGQPTDITHVGEHFLGVDEGCFKKTAFIGESKVSFSDSGELDEAIRNMVYSADEEIDSTKAIKKLDTLRRYYLGKTGKSGEIYNLEKEISELEEQRDKWQNGHKELMSAEFNLGELSKKIAYNNSQKEKLEKEQLNLRAVEAKKRLDDAQRLKDEALKSREECEKLLESLRNGSFVADEAFAQVFEQILREISQESKNIKDLSDSVEQAKESMENIYADEAQRSISKSLEESGEDCDKVLSRVQSLTKKAKSFLVLAIIFTLLVLTLPIGIFFFIKRLGINKQITELCRRFGCDDAGTLESRLSGIASYRSIEKNAKDMLKNAAERHVKAEQSLGDKLAMLKDYSVKCGFDAGQSTDELLDNASHYLTYLKEQHRKLSQLKAKCSNDYTAYKTLAESMDMQALSSLASQIDESIPVRDESVIKRELAFYTQANDALTVKERELEKTAAVLAGTLPKPGEIQSRIISLSGTRDSMVEKHKGLEMAIEALEKAAESMKKEAAPLIAGQSGELFSQITDGKYTALFTDSEMNLSFLQKNEAQTREAGYLSTGTLDAAYISLRIALCKFLYKENPVLVFDDAFGHMDDERLENTLDFIHKLSDEFQIVILSCHSREKSYFEGKAKIINFEIGKGND